MMQDQFVQLYSSFVFSTFKEEGRFLADKNGIVLVSNPQKLPIPIEVGQNIIEYLSSFSREISIAKLQKISNTNSGFQYNIKVRHNGGYTSYYSVLFSPIQNDSFLGLLIQIQDITKCKEIEIKHAEKDRRIENEMMLRTREIMHTREIVNSQGGFLKNFLRGLRHDIKSPVAQLREIITYYKTAVDPKKKAQAAELIDNCLDKLSNTSRGFSDFVDVNFMNEDLQQNCSFASIYEEVISFLQAEIEAKNANIEFNFDNAEYIQFNKAELISIFSNVLSNAIKFSKTNSPLEIQIKTEQKENIISLTISDNGTGIDLDKNKEQLYEPFKRFHVDRPGNGIGLSLVKNILDRNDSVIKIESKLEQGTSVTIDFKHQKPLPERNNSKNAIL